MNLEWQHYLAIGAALALAALAVLVVREMRGRTMTKWQWVFWWIAYYLVRVQWWCSGPRRIQLPDDGRGVVFISNHRSSIDPFFIEIIPDKVIRWMVAKEYVDHWFFGFFLKRCDVVPTKRGGIDNAATRAVIEIAKSGGYVGMFPEGRLNHTDKFMVSVRPGAILVALRANARVVPVYIHNSPFYRWVWSPLVMIRRTSVKVGEPIDLSEYRGQERDPEVIRRLLLQCVGEIAKLAGKDDFVPEIAGRRWSQLDVPGGEQSAGNAGDADEEARH